MAATMVLLLRSQTSRIRLTRRRTGCPATGRRQPARRRTGVDRRCSHRVAGIVVLAAWILSAFAADSFGQMSGYHSVHHGVMPPGAIGSLQLERGGPLPGYFQPVQIKGPPGVVGGDGGRWDLHGRRDRAHPRRAVDWAGVPVSSDEHPVESGSRAVSDHRGRRSESTRPKGWNTGFRSWSSCRTTIS